MTFRGRPSAGSGRRSFRRGRMAKVLLAGRRLRRRGRRLDHNLIFMRLLSGRDPETGEKWVWRDPGFVSAPLRFGLQTGLATLAMLAILTFVDSLSTAAIAAGLASSVVGIFIAPSNLTARIRSVAGGHGVALVLGSMFSAILFLAPVEIFLQDRSIVLHFSLALAVGGSMLLMAITNTEHPPAAGTALGMASREFDVLIFFSIIGAVGLLAILKLVLRPYLRDLT